MIEAVSRDTRCERWLGVPGCVGSFDFGVGCVLDSALFISSIHTCTLVLDDHWQ